MFLSPAHGFLQAFFSFLFTIEGHDIAVHIDKSGFSRFAGRIARLSAHRGLTRGHEHRLGAYGMSNDQMILFLILTTFESKHAWQSLWSRSWKGPFDTYMHHSALGRKSHWQTGKEAVVHSGEGVQSKIPVQMDSGCMVKMLGPAEDSQIGLRVPELKSHIALDS